jgi:DNA-binding response OmpR family regulator
LRRTGRLATVLEAGDLLIDESGGWATRTGQPIPLTATELRLLAFLVRHRGQALSKDQLVDSASSKATGAADRSTQARGAEQRRPSGDVHRADQRRQEAGDPRRCRQVTPSATAPSTAWS